MNILYLTPFVQHPKLQTSFRHYYFLRELSRRHRITLLTPTKTPVPPDVLQELRSYTEELLVFDAVRAPRSAAHRLVRPIANLRRKVQQIQKERAALQAMRKTFLELASSGKFDLVLLHGRGVFSVIEGFDGLPLVLDICDASSTLFRGTMEYADTLEKPLHWIRYLTARRRERRVAAKSPHLAFISFRDRAAILGDDSTAAVIPNAVDLEYWQRKTPAPQRNCIVFHGGMNYRPNVDGALHLVRRIVPLLRPSVPDLEVLIVGRDPVPELVEALRGQENVTLTGGVEDVRPYLEQALVYVAPIRFAAGQQNKLLEAMAMEIPCVTTPVGAAGLRVSAEQPPVVVAQDDAEFAERVLELMKRPPERARLAAAGRAYIEHHFTAARCVGMLEEMCLAAAHGGKQVNPRRTGGDRTWGGVEVLGS